MTTRPCIGVIGGSGFYRLLDHAGTVDVDTPFGAPSAPPAVGEIGGRAVAFLPRHGTDHRYPAHRINYRANLWVLRELGVRQVLAPCAVGSLSPDLGPGTIVVPDQVVDRTQGRVGTYYDHGAVHVTFADPYCPDGHRAVLGAAAGLDRRVTSGGTMVVVEGPRFSTRAESAWYQAAGWSLINMTGLPEAALARELALCYTPLALVTDLDAGVEASEAVHQADVFTTFAEHIPQLKELVATTVSRLPGERRCPCPRALDGLEPRLRIPGSYEDGANGADPGPQQQADRVPDRRQH